MTEAQPMNLMEIVSDYPIDEKDSLRHIDSTKELSEDATMDQEPATAPSRDPKVQKHLQMMTYRHQNTRKGSTIGRYYPHKPRSRR